MSMRSVHYPESTTGPPTVLYLIRSEAAVVCVCGPLVPELVPLIVTVYVPWLVEGPVVITRLAVPEPLIELGENVALAPVGKPLTVRLTASLKPPMAPTDTPKEVLLPALMLAEEGETDSEKSAVAAAWTVNVTVVL